MAETVRIDDRGTRQMQKWLKEAVQANGGPDSNPVKKMLRQWGHIYLASMQRRYSKLSRGGGGEWPKLKPATVKGRTAAPFQRVQGKRGQRVTLAGSAQRARRSLRANTNPRTRSRLVKKLIAIGDANASILIDTRALWRGLNPGALGNLENAVSGGIEIGWGATKHPGSAPTFGDIARFHHFGMGRNPRRELLVGPDTDALITMGRAARTAGVKMENKIGD